MSEKYRNKYRIASARAEWWDYASNAAYFITICTANRKHFFGEIKDRKMNLSNVGILADVFWHEIKNHSKFVELDAFVVMPNHIHGILVLNKDSEELNEQNVPFVPTVPIVPFVPFVETRHALSLPSPSPSPSNSMTNKTIAQQRFQNQGKNTVSSIIGSYKSAVTKHANRLGLEFGWQTRFHDHIIKNDKDFVKISNYIENNVANWNDDKFYS
jgi:putative transposase